MGTLTIEDPNRYETKKVDSSGKIYVGRDISDCQVRLIIESVEDGDE